MSLPGPLGQAGRVDAQLEGLVARSDLSVKESLSSSSARVAELGDAVNGINGQAEAIRLVADGQLKRGVNVTLLVVTTDVDMLVAGSLVGETMHHPGVAVEVEDDGSVVSEQADPLLVGHTVRVVDVVDQLEQINNVDDADLEIREVLQEQIHGSNGLVGGDITARGHDDVGLAASVSAEVRPDTNTLGAMLDGSIHVKELEMVLLVGNDDVDIVVGADAVVHNY